MPFKKLLTEDEAAEVAKAAIARNITFTCRPGKHDMVCFEVEDRFSEELKNLTSHYVFPFNKPPESRKLEKEFPESTIGEHVSTTGRPIGGRSSGVTVLLHWREDELLPCCAEVFDTKSGGNRHYAEIGLVWDSNGSICDYDGADNWIKEIGLLLKEWDEKLDLSYVGQ